MNISKLYLSGMCALLGVITPNVRKVFMSQDSDSIGIYFFYDKEPSELEIELAEIAGTEVIADFPSTFSLICEKKVIPYPTRIDFSDHSIYSRYEPAPEDVE